MSLWSNNIWGEYPPLVRMFCSTEQLGALRIYAGISLSDFYANIRKVGPSISLSGDT